VALLFFFNPFGNHQLSDHLAIEDKWVEPATLFPVDSFLKSLGWHFVIMVRISKYNRQSQEIVFGHIIGAKKSLTFQK
jgi:hypothetical protein